MGPNANDSVMMWGNYTGYPTRTITALKGISQKTKVKYIQGCGLTRNESFESRYDRILSPLGHQGMRATYWNNTEMKGEPATTVTINNPVHLSNGGNTVFAPGVNLEHFSACLEGTFIPTEDETLIFDTSADDKLRLIVNRDTLINSWRVVNRMQVKRKELEVKAGKRYQIQIDYVQETGYGALNFDIQKRINPTAQELLAQIGNIETIVFVGGISPSLEGEEMKVNEPGFKGGDRTSIELPQAQRDMLKMLHDAGKKVIFVNCSGGAMGLTPEMESCDAIIQWWYDGENGGTALAEVLSGDYNPSGKLPVTFYKSTDDLSSFLDYTMKNRTYRYFKGEPLYPFGFGLSYTTFDISQPQYINNKVRVRIKNTGKVDGTEVVQVYIRNIADIEGPQKTLRAYQRVGLKAGESKTVEIDFPRNCFEGWDVETNTMRVVPGKYELMAGSSSADKDLKKIIVDIK